VEGRQQAGPSSYFFCLRFVLRVECFLLRLTVVVIMIIVETELRARVAQVACAVVGCGLWCAVCCGVLCAVGHWELSEVNWRDYVK
jgi:hypothetical protein